MNIFLIQDSDGAILNSCVFSSSFAAVRYTQRFGEPGWSVIAVPCLNLDEVNTIKGVPIDEYA